MILILGRLDDKSTTDVVEWLNYFNQRHIVINTDELNMTIIEYNSHKNLLLLEQNGIVVNLFDIKAVWNRRHGFSVVKYVNSFIDENVAFFPEKGDKYHYYQLKGECSQFFDFMHYILDNKSIKNLGAFAVNDVNKMIVLDKAKLRGLNTPSSYVLTKKKDLVELLRKEKKLITKSLAQGVYRPHGKNYSFYSYVEKVSSNLMKKIPENFFPSLFQVEIKKQYELRVFFLNKEFYSMAIFSQKHEETSVDFRKNNVDSPLRYVPYKLPKYIEEKLTLLMNDLQLNTGSIDMIVDNKNEFYFLEVNPCGQFEMTSFPCNYFLERKIAKYLSE